MPHLECIVGLSQRGPPLCLPFASMRRSTPHTAVSTLPIVTHQSSTATGSQYQSHRYSYRSAKPLLTLAQVDWQNQLGSTDHTLGYPRYSHKSRSNAVHFRAQKIGIIWKPLNTQQKARLRSLNVRHLRSLTAYDLPLVFFAIEVLPTTRLKQIKRSHVFSLWITL